MSKIAKKTSQNSYPNCARMGRNKGPNLSVKGCLKCRETYSNRFNDCKALAKTTAETKKTDKKKSKALPLGRWGYRVDSYTDNFCKAIFDKPILMSQTLPSSKDFIKGTNGPHPKAYKRLFELQLADKLPTGHIYMTNDVQFKNGRYLPVKSRRAPAYKKAMAILKKYKADQKAKK